MAGPAAIEKIADLTVIRGDREVVHDVSFDGGGRIGDGLLRTSRCSKTILMRAIVGVQLHASAPNGAWLVGVLAIANALLLLCGLFVQPRRDGRSPGRRLVGPPVRLRLRRARSDNPSAGAPHDARA